MMSDRWHERISRCLLHTITTGRSGTLARDHTFIYDLSHTRSAATQLHAPPTLNLSSLGFDSREVLSDVGSARYETTQHPITPPLMLIYRCTFCASPMQIVVNHLRPQLWDRISAQSKSSTHFGHTDTDSDTNKRQSEKEMPAWTIP